MAQFCRRHSYRDGKSPAELVRRLRAAPASANPIAPNILEAIVRASTAQIRLLNTEVELTRLRGHHVVADELEDVRRGAVRRG